MAGGLTVSVRQIASYPALTPPTLTANDLVLLQQGGLGGPYATVNVGTLVANGLQAGPALGVGTVPPANAEPQQIFAGLAAVVPLNGGITWNGYNIGGGQGQYWQSGVVLDVPFNPVTGLTFNLATAGQAGETISPASWTTLMALGVAGNLALPYGTLTVARDPNAALEVATMGYVGRQTVAAFNGRRGFVTLDACDIGMALGYPTECIATLPQVDAAICRAIQDLIHTYPAVWSWNGRVGDVWLTLDDINNVLANAGAPILVPTPPTDANDSEAVNAAWVISYVASQLANYATEAWVTAQIAAINLGVTSFNGRTGPVSLTYLDVASLGFVQQNSPALSGIPTAPTAAAGNSSAQLATTAFVMNAITSATTGVISWQGRTGAVTMVLSDITSVGGAPTASPNFTGTPAAPTAALGTSTQQIATTAFVMNEITASTGGVVSFNGRSGIVTLLTADITAAGGAPNASPALTGIPTAPTAANGTNTQQLATTAFVQNSINAIDAGVTTFNGRSGAVSLTANDISAAGGLANPAPQLTSTGTTYPTSVTTAPADNSTNIATTAFVQAAIANIGGGYLPLSGGANMTGQFNLSGNATANLNPVPLQQLNATLATYAPLDSPALGGTPTAPTAATATSTTQLATTAFVHAGLAGYLPLGGGTVTGQTNFTQVGAFATNTYAINVTDSSGNALVRLGPAYVSGAASGGGTLNIAGISGTTSVNLAAIGLGSSNVTLGSAWVSLSSAAGGFGVSPPGGGNLNTITLNAINTNFGGNVTTGPGSAFRLSNTAVLNAYGTTGMGWALRDGTQTTAYGFDQGNTNQWIWSTTSGVICSLAMNGLLTTGNLSFATAASRGQGISYNVWSGNLVGFGWSTVLTAYVDGNAVGTVSDMTLKANVAAPSEDALSTLNQLTLYQYDLPDRITPYAPPQHFNMGFSAQQLQTLVPESVHEVPSGRGTILMLPDWEPLVSRCVGAIQRLTAMIEQLQAAVGALQQAAGQAVTVWETT